MLPARMLSPPFFEPEPEPEPDDPLGSRTLTNSLCAAVESLVKLSSCTYGAPALALALTPIVPNASSIYTFRRKACARSDNGQLLVLGLEVADVPSRRPRLGCRHRRSSGSGTALTSVLMQKYERGGAIPRRYSPAKDPSRQL
jgi:hypothetical protein